MYQNYFASDNLLSWRFAMGKPKILDGVKLSIKIPISDLKRLKIEAIEREMLESSIVLEALRLHWNQAGGTAAMPVVTSVEPLTTVQAESIPTPILEEATTPIPAPAEPYLAVADPTLAPAKRVPSPPSLSSRMRRR
jgi:hypothetical protein